MTCKLWGDPLSTSATRSFLRALISTNTVLGSGLDAPKTRNVHLYSPFLSVVWELATGKAILVISALTVQSKNNCKLMDHLFINADILNNKSHFIYKVRITKNHPNIPWRQIPTLTLQPKLVETARAINPKPENSFEKLVVSWILGRSSAITHNVRTQLKFTPVQSRKKCSILKWYFTYNLAVLNITETKEMKKSRT